MDMKWLLNCDVLLRIPGESMGADTEVIIAKKHSIPIIYNLEDLKEEII